MTSQSSKGMAWLGISSTFVISEAWKNECCLNVAQKVKLLYIPLQRILSNVPMDAIEMSS